MFGEYRSIMIFYEGSLTMAHCKKIKLSFRIHAQLINMDLQESMIINDKEYIQIHASKHLHEAV
jgi:hypothetical protein